MGIIIKNGVVYGANSGASDIIPLIVPDYNDDSQYEVGDCVFYDGNLYKCKTQINSGESWNANHWELTSIVDLLKLILNKNIPVLLTKSVTQNGVYYASGDNADGYSVFTVNVPQNSSSPTGTRNIIANGTYDVSNYANAIVNVQFSTASKTITENGTYSADDEEIDGYSEITVNIQEKTPRREITGVYIFDLTWEAYATDEAAIDIEIEEEYEEGQNG